ncbi:MAG: hypothetical protein QOH63_341 [Acidobacteriota bacterium]|jgi:predicted ATPase/DNA-binding winged helix-turn-helix (wHTH) protein|nr:hypothetical protein [Acidobacteriota bacterium]
MAQSAPLTLYFEPFHISSDVDLLYMSEQVIPLEPLAVRVLRYLVMQHHRVVPKEELLEKIWPEVFTTDGVLKKAISQARRALGDNAEESRYIKTYHARGYRFIAPVRFAHGDELSEAKDEAALQPGFHAQATGQQNLTQPATHAVDPDFDQLVGREGELQILKAEYRRILEGAGQPVLIMGEPGIGKTQLARHFGRWARAQNAHYIYARFFDYGGSRLAPYEVFLNLLRAAFGSPGAVTQEARQTNQGEMQHHLRETARETCGVTLPEELFVEAETLSGPRELLTSGGTTTGGNYRVVIPISECFLRLSRARPLVMILDDLQWADEASRDVIGYMMRSAQGEPLMLVALARAEEAAGDASPLADWLKHQANYRAFISLNLKPLDEHSCHSSIKAVFGGERHSPPIPPQDLRRLYQITGGNPYFLTETLRLLIAERAISCCTKDGMQWRWHGIKDMRLPDTLVMATRAKLDRLPSRVREMAECASVIGDEFRVVTLCRMTGKSEVEVEELLCEGVRRGVLSERALSAGEDCRFYHTILRRVLYESIPLMRRKRLHARAGQALEEVYAHEADRIAEALSAHYEAAGDPRKTFEWSLRAWQAASSRWQWPEAVTGIERAANAAAEIERRGTDQLTPNERLKLWLGLGEGYCSIGNLKESQSFLGQAISLAATLSDDAALASAYLIQGQTQIGLSQYNDAISSTKRAIEIYRRLQDESGAQLSLMQLCNVYGAIGKYEEVSQLVAQVVENAAENEEVLTTASGILGWAHVLQGAYREGVPLLERTLEYVDRVGDVRRRAHWLRRLQWAQQGQGQYEAAIQLAMRAREDFKSVGDLLGEAKSDYGIGQARVAQGLYVEGIKYLKRALDQLRDIGDTHCEAEVLWALGRGYCESGQAIASRAALTRAIELIREVNDLDDEFRFLIDLARLELVEGNYQEAQTKAVLAAIIAGELSNRDGLGAALVESAHARLKLHDQKPAFEEAAQAVNLLRETNSGDLWRGYYVLALCLDAPGHDAAHPAEDSCVLEASRQAIKLLNQMREQIDAGDAARRATITQARREIVRGIQAILIKHGCDEEADTVSKQWLLEESFSGSARE